MMLVLYSHNPPKPLCWWPLVLRALAKLAKFPDIFPKLIEFIQLSGKSIYFEKQ